MKTASTSATILFVLLFSSSVEAVPIRNSRSFERQQQNHSPTVAKALKKLKIIGTGAPEDARLRYWVILPGQDRRQLPDGVPIVTAAQNDIWKECMFGPYNCNWLKPPASKTSGNSGYGSSQERAQAIVALKSFKKSGFLS